MDWLDEFAAALREAGAEVVIGDDERRALLRLAREVAHRTERVFAPLSTYLVGRFVAERTRAGDDAGEAVRRAFAVAQGILPPPERETAPPGS